jgi:hypothetical protein
MSDQNVIDFIGEQFRRLNLRFDKFELDLADLRGRVIVLEESQASMSARIATLEVSTAGVIKRLDRIENRLDRIERRLDLVEAH